MSRNEVEQSGQLKQYPFKSHFIDLDGHRLHYLDEGTDSDGKPTLLMVHGNPTWSYYWRKLILEFRKDYRVICLDHIGCGFSDKPRDYPYTLEKHIDNLERLVEELKLKDISLFVHDWGGAIGTGFAGRNSEKIRSLVIFNTAAFPSKRIPLRIAVCRIPIFGKFVIQGLNGFARAATFMATAKGMSSETKEGYLAPYQTFSDRIAHLRFVEDIPLKPSHPSWETLKSVEAGLENLKDHPAILLWGAKDWCFDDSFLQQWRKKLPQAGVTVFDDAGHYVVEDACSEIIPLVTQFLAKNKSVEKHDH